MIFKKFFSSYDVDVVEPQVINSNSTEFIYTNC